MVDLDLTAGGQTDAQAQSILDRYRLTGQRGANGFEIRLVGEPQLVLGDGLIMTLAARAELVVVLPRDIVLDAKVGDSRIEAQGPFAKCRVASRHGNVAIARVRGDVTVESGSGIVHVEQVQGADEARIESHYGSIELDGIGASRLIATAETGQVRARKVAGAMEVHTGYGAVRLEDCRGAATVETSSGDIEVLGLDGLDGGPTTLAIQGGRGTIRADGVFAQVTIQNDSGDVTVSAREGSRVIGEWSLRSGFGNVTLEAASDLVARLSLSTDYGKVFTALPIEVEGEPSRRRIVGTLNGGDKPIRIQTSSGDVALRRLGGQE